jgi:hypothetical protein
MGKSIKKKRINMLKKECQEMKNLKQKNRKIQSRKDFDMITSPKLFVDRKLGRTGKLLRHYLPPSLVVKDLSQHRERWIEKKTE